MTWKQSLAFNNDDGKNCTKKNQQIYLQKNCTIYLQKKILKKN